MVVVQCAGVEGCEGRVGERGSGGGEEKEEVR